MSTQDRQDQFKKMAETSVSDEAAATERQHKRGKLTARERVANLVDDQSFVEIDALVRHQASGFGTEEVRPLGDAVVTGWGTVNGRTVFVYSEDFTKFGGSLGAAMSKKICKVIDLAMSTGAPIIGLKDSGGARIQEGVVSLDGYGQIFERNVRASGVIPQISVIMGPCAGGAVYSPALTDFVYQVDGTSHLFITGPDVIKTVTGEDVSMEELGGAAAHATKSGVTHFVAASEEAALQEVRYLLSFLPDNNQTRAPRFESNNDPDASPLDQIIPDSPNQPYDMSEAIRHVVDNGEFYEVHRGFATNLVVGFGRIDGRSVGLVGNQPASFAGTLDIDAAEKGARFVRFCDAFNIPIVTFVDVPGFLPGVEQEHRGIIRHGAKLLYAYAEATVPKITVITRKAYGGAYVVMNSRGVRADLVLAWPTAEIAVMGAAGAVNIIHRRQIAESADAEETRKQLTSEYEDRFSNPYVAAEHGLVDEVIMPSATRERLISALGMLEDKRETLPAKKHSNLPL
jgi:propionyl-CoA carboxylase beta chain